MPTPTGDWASSLRSWVQLETGLNYRDERGQWQPSSDQIELFEKGAVYRRGQFQVLFAPNLADPVPVHLRTPAGVELKTRFLGLAYYSAASGQSVMIGEAQDTMGELAAGEGNGVRSIQLTNEIHGGVGSDMRRSDPITANLLCHL